MKFIEYPKCTTCQKAKKWQRSHVQGAAIKGQTAGNE